MVKGEKSMVLKGRGLWLKGELYGDLSTDAINSKFPWKHRKSPWREKPLPRISAIQWKHAMPHISRLTPKGRDLWLYLNRRQICSMASSKGERFMADNKLRIVDSSDPSLKILIKVSNKQAHRIMHRGQKRPVVAMSARALMKAKKTGWW